MNTDYLPVLRGRDPGEARFVERYGHSSLCNCVRRFRGRLLANSLRRCNCFMGSGGPIGAPGPPTVQEIPLAERLLAVLRKVEWGIDFECPDCGGSEANGHRPGCELRAVLEEASRG